MSADARARLEAVLAEEAGQPVTVSALEPVTGGYSRSMHRVTLLVGGREERVIWRADPPAEQEIVRTDRAREFGVLTALGGRTGAPRPRHFDADGSRLGSVGMLVDYIDGCPLHAHLRDSPPDGWPGLVRSVARTAAAVHGVPSEDLADVLGTPPTPEEHLDATIASWRELADEQVEPAPLMRYVVEWLDRHRPPPLPLVLLHGDLQTPNVIVDGDRTSLIDWEFARFGDPREDLGYFAAMAAISPPDPIAGDLTTLCEAYREATGLGEAEINPMTVSYFSILPFGPMVRQFVGQVRDLAEGRNRSLRTANLAYVLTAMVEGWVGLVRQLDAATLETR